MLVLTFQKNLKCILLPPPEKIELSPSPQIIVKLISQKISLNNVLISIQCDACVKFSEKSNFCTLCTYVHVNHVKLISQKISKNSVLISIQCDASARFSEKANFCTNVHSKQKQ